MGQVEVILKDGDVVSSWTSGAVGTVLKGGSMVPQVRDVVVKDINLVSAMLTWAVHVTGELSCDMVGGHLQVTFGLSG
jgi:hypothetical protein